MKKFQMENDFVKYLSYINDEKDKYLIIIAIKDTIGFFLDSNICVALSNLGLKTFNCVENIEDLHWRGYAAVIDHGKVLFESLARRDEAVWTRENIHGQEVDIFSGSLHSGNIASIIIQSEEYAVNKRGFNICIASLEDNIVFDSVAFDTHSETKKAIRLSDYRTISVIPHEKDDLIIKNINDVKKRLNIECIIPKFDLVHEDNQQQIKVRVFFFGWYPLWNAMESVVNAFEEDETYDVCVIMETLDRTTRDCLIRGGHNVIETRDYDIEKDKPVIAIYNNCYKHYMDYSTIKYKVLIPAGIVGGHMRNFGMNTMTNYIAKMKKRVDGIFVEKNIYDHIKDGAKQNVFPFGNPKFDLIYNKINNTKLPSEWGKLKGKKTILWAFDHHWYTSNVTFDLYARHFFEYFEMNDELALLIRPHANYPRELIADGIWNRRDVEILKRYCINSVNIIWDDSLDYGAAYSLAKAVITDVNCGITISAMPLNVPIAVLLRFDGNKCEPQYKEVYDSLYHINGREELVSFFDMVRAGNDPLQDKRNDIKDDCISNFDGGNGKRIKACIEKTYRNIIQNGG